MSDIEGDIFEGVGEEDVGLNQLFSTPRPTSHRDPQSPVRLFKNGRAEESGTPGELHLLLTLKQVDNTPLPRDVFQRELIVNWILRYAYVHVSDIQLLNSYDVLVQFDGNIIVTNVSLLLQKVTVLAGLGIQVTCLVATADKLREAATAKEQQRAVVVPNDLQMEMFRAITAMQEQMQKLQLEVKTSRSRSEAGQGLTGQIPDTPSESSDELGEGGPPHGIVPPPPNALVGAAAALAPAIPGPSGSRSSTLTDSKIKLKLPIFSGDEVRQKHEADFKSWLFKVNMMTGTVPENNLRQLIIDSLRGSASELVMFLGLDTPVTTIIDRMKNQFGDVSSADVLMTKFYELRQGKGEKVATFYSRLVATLDQIRRSCPGTVDEATASQHLKNRLWFGIHATSRNSLRYLYDQSHVTHQDLLTACRALEAESGLSNVRLKAATVTDTNTEVGNDNSENEAIEVQVKGASYNDRSKGKDNNSHAQGGRGKNFSQNNNGKSNQKNRRRSKGKSGRKCYGCGGVGHYKRECPTWLNQNRGQMKEGDLPPQNNQGTQEGENPSPPQQ